MALRTDRIGFGNLTLVQDPDQFCYGVDAVLLAHFAACRAADAKAICDLGSGTGIIPLILSHKLPAASLAGVEVQPWAAELFRQNVQDNGLADRIQVLEGNVTALTRAGKDAGANTGVDHDATSPWQSLGGTFDAVTCNPPYTAERNGLQSHSQGKAIARHEILASLEEFLQGASFLLRHRGDLFLIHRPRRLTDLLCACRQVGIEPKTLQLLSGHREEPPNLILLHGVKGGGKELTILPPGYLRERDGSWSLQALEAYERQGKL